MAKEVHRRLAAILAADVVGYSRLMGDDEAGTLAALQSHREELFEPKAAQHHGRTVKLMGDGALMEFGSVVDAVTFAVEVQIAMRQRNSGVTEDRQIVFRIGINLGDIILQDEDIYGDGVNVAARLEGLAEPGGICLSRAARDQVRDKLDLRLVDLGEVEVKNISRPVRAFQIILDDKATALVTSVVRQSVKTERRQRPLAIAAVMALLLAAGGAFWWQPWAPDVEPASVERMAFPLPEKPSIAVLPFDNLSGDSEQDYWVDGTTEAIITTLAKVPDLFVIARNSTFTYKGKPTKVQQVAEELGVRYVLEGSVQRSGDRVRVNAQLIDALSGRHVWAEQFDRTFDDLFALQDDLTKQIVMEMEVKLTAGEQARLWGKRSPNLEAYQLYLRGMKHHRVGSKEGNALSREFFEKAVALDPNVSGLWVVLGRSHYAAARFGWSEDRDQSLKLAVEAAEKAMALDDTNPAVYALLGLVHFLKREHDRAIENLERAVELSPSSALNLAFLANVLEYSGRPGESIPLIKQAMRLHPRYRAWYLGVLGQAYRLTGRYKDAIAAYQEMVERKSYVEVGNVRLAVLHVAIGREDEAQRYVDEVLSINPKFSLKDWAGRTPYKNVEDLERELQLMRKAGLPDIRPASKEKLAFPLPNKPSIAVLPFDNLSADPEQEYFADGVTNDIITDLSKFKNLFVIASNSTFSYKGKRVKVQQVAEELSVRYVLEGSIQRAGDRVRINAQLIDAATGHHMWAERYERELKDIFALQDEIVQTIVATVTGRLMQAEGVRAKRKSTDSLEAYELALRARQARVRFTKEGNAEALRLLQSAIELDPEYARAHAGLAGVHLFDAILGWSESPAESINRAFEFAKRAVALDDSDYLGHWYLGRALIAKKEFDQGLAEYDKAMALNPNAADLRAHMGLALTWVGRPEEAVGWIKKAMRLNPYYGAWYAGVLGFAYYMVSQYEEAIAPLMEAVNRNPKALWMRTHLAASYGQLGRDEEARNAAAGILEINPEFSINRWRRGFGLSIKNPADLEHHLDGLRKAGLPE